MATPSGPHRFVLREHRGEALQLVCRDEADAAFLEARYLDRSLVGRPAGCEGAGFRLAVIEGISLELAILALPPYAWQAEALRAEIGHLALESQMAASLEARLLLGRLGCRADTVADGREAVVAARRVRYDFVLMDCQMPELDGYGATRAIRAAEAGSGLRTPIIALTANTLRGESENCLAAGMDSHLTKPVRAEELAAVVDRWIANSPSSGDAENIAARLEELAESGFEPEDLWELIDGFLETTPAILPDLRAALGRAELDAAAHTI